MMTVGQGARARPRGWLVRGFAAVVVAASAGCGSSAATSAAGPPTATHAASRQPGTGKPPVTLGSKNFTEETILGQLYVQALRAKGYAVTVDSDVGDSEFMGRELSSGQIAGYPEYTGTILSVFARNRTRLVSAQQAYLLAAQYERTQGNTLLAMAPAHDTDVVITTPTYAATHGLRSLADLARLGPSAVLAGPPEFKLRFNGMVGLSEDYAVRHLRFLPVPIGDQYTALSDGRAQLAVAFTTDGNLTRGGYALLADPKNIFGFQNVAFLVRSSVLSREGPAFAQTINAVSAILSTEALRLMNAAVTLDGQSPAAVAHHFLGANGLA